MEAENVDRRAQPPVPMGRLRVYLGAAPGAGKTYAMLRDACQMREQGLDVVIGRVDDHGSADARALEVGLEFVPPRTAVEPDARTLDVQAIIERRPDLVLVDDYARECRGDGPGGPAVDGIAEVLRAGVAVYSTLNLQDIHDVWRALHLPSPLEPPTLLGEGDLDRIDEMTVVDVQPRDLCERVRARQFCPSPSAAQALYTEDALVTLRELTLRYAMEHGQRQQRRLRHQAPLEPVTMGTTLLVWDEADPVASRVVAAAKRIADTFHSELLVVRVDPPGAGPRREPARGGCAEIDAAVPPLDAPSVTVSGDDTPRELLELAHKRTVERIIVTTPRGSPRRRLRAAAMRRALQRHAPHVDLFFISDGRAPDTGTLQGRMARAATRLQGAAPHLGALAGHLWALVLTLVITSLCVVLVRPPDPTNPLLLYLVAVVYIAYRFGTWPATTTVVLSLLATDYLFITPYYSLAVARPQDVGTLGIFLLVALVVSQLTAGLRTRNEHTRQRERRVRTLYELTKALADVRTQQDLAKLATEEITQEFDRPCAVLLADARRQVVLDGPARHSRDLDVEQRAAQSVFDSSLATGSTSATLPRAEHSYLAIRGSSGAIAVLALLHAKRYRDMAPEQHELLETMIHQIGLAMERIELAARARSATLQAESEALKNSLLSAIAHDFRTPLASIIAASSTLLGGRSHLSESQSVELTDAILQEGQRMAKLCNNTLELARVESGAVTLRREWHPAEELVGAVVSGMQDRLINHIIETRLPPGVPMAQVDGALIVQVLENMVENAVKYTPRGSKIVIGAEQGQHRARFWVNDDGPGIAKGDESRIFEKFYRGRAAGAQHGIGLGLAICQAIVHAHGGSIVARNQLAGGVEFSFSIPHLESPPVLVPEE